MLETFTYAADRVADILLCQQQEFATRAWDIEEVSGWIQENLGDEPLLADACANACRTMGVKTLADLSQKVDSKFIASIKEKLLAQNFTQAQVERVSHLFRVEAAFHDQPPFFYVNCSPVHRLRRSKSDSRFNLTEETDEEEKSSTCHQDDDDDESVTEETNELEKSSICRQESLKQLPKKLVESPRTPQLPKKLVESPRTPWSEMTDDDAISTASTTSPSFCPSNSEGCLSARTCLSDFFTTSPSRASSKESSQAPSMVWARSKKPAGSRDVQTDLEEGSEEDKRQIASGLASHVYAGAMDKFANYVLQKVIQVVEPQDLQFMIDEIVDKGEMKVIMLAKHRYGHRVLEQLLRRCTPKQVQGIGELMLPHMVELAKHKEGNFVLQGLLAVQEFEQVTQTMPLVKHIDSIAQDFHGSLVLESVLQASSMRNQTLAATIARMISDRPSLQSAIMMKLKNGHKLIKLALMLGCNETLTSCGCSEKEQSVAHGLRSSAPKSMWQTPLLQSKGLARILDCLCPRLQSEIKSKLKKGDKRIEAILKQQCPPTSPQGLYSSAGVLMHN